MVGQPDRADWIVHGLAVGGFAGLIGGMVAGGSARLAMRVFAVSVEHPTDFTIGGSAVIMISGMIIGVAVGVAYVAARRVLPGPWAVRGLFFGALMAALVLLGFANTPPDEAVPDPVLGAALFALIALEVGVVTAAAASWLDKRLVAPVGTPSGSLVLGALIGTVGALELTAFVVQLAGALIS